MNPVINLMGYKVYSCILDSINTNDKDIKSIVVAEKKGDYREWKRNIC